MDFATHLGKGINKVDLKKIEEAAASCKLCNLYMGRKNPVFAKGNPKASLIICGMVPAFDENKAGIPFVGRAGKLLDKILTTVYMTLDDVYITNLVKCFLAPGKNLDQEWINACFPYIISQISIIKPSVILTLGLPASISLLGLDSKTTLGSIRGKVFKYSDSMNIDIIPTYHPSFLLRKGGDNNEFFDKVIEDFELARYAVAQKKEAS